MSTLPSSFVGAIKGDDKTALVGYGFPELGSDGQCQESLGDFR